MDPSAELVGRQLGDYRLLELIGAGGMGVAYRAEQPALGREAVVKLLSARASDEQAKARFLREARLASRLDHPYAAHIYAFGAESDGLLWIAMELVRGIPLDRMIADQGAFPLARFVPLFDRLCEVVFSAHEQGIVHRDIKPANVMVVRRAGRLLPKLLDFGIARNADTYETPGDPTAASEDTKLTNAGRLGSPGYMAPEMWLDAGKADARSDLYALAITGYEMLTARRLFDGPTELAIARAHARAEVPPLGPGFPGELDRVFVRALAKLPPQRYANVLELGAAIRESARAAAPDTPAEFDEAVRDTFVAGGPQPIAETLIELAAARDPATAVARAGRTADVLARALAIVALATRAGVGNLLGADAAERLRTLVERGLDRDEWLALIAALVEPFEGNALAHPLPELVERFGSRGEARALFAAIPSVAGEGIDARDAMAALARVLRACAFVTDYLWVAAGDNGGESWMGPRRDTREPCALPTTAPPGSVWLTDRDGAPLVQLSPFCHIAVPSPGEPMELFLLDGPARRGARCVAWPREFERYDEGLLHYIADHLAPLGTGRGSAHAEQAVPYRGLASFGFSDSAMFFGREREVEGVVNRLRVHSLIAVVGPSGVGKSSFVHAGVLPALPDTWQTVTLRPGALPLDALEARFVAEGIASAGLADALRANPAVLAETLDAAARQQGNRIVIVIDQFEEVFTQCRDVATRDQLARALAALGGEVRVIITLRDDFLVRTAELPELGARLATSLELVTLPDRATLRRILVEPLRHIGYTFESDKMPDEMIAEVHDHPGALALLSFAASRLWELRDRTFQHIPRRAYDSIGGVVGALAKHAEDTLAALPDDEHRHVRELFRHLVTSEGTRATLYRAEAIQLLGKTAAAERVIETLVERRLLVGYEGEAHTERLEVIHEALLTAWPRLVTWQREDAEGARMRDQVRSAARQWGERHRPKGLLWRGDALLELKLWRSRHGGAITDLEHEFTVASTADDTRARRLRRIALATVVVGLATGLVVLQRANGIARRNAEESRRANLAMLVEQGRVQLNAGRPQEAVVYLAAAYERGAEDPNLGFLLGTGEAALSREKLVMRSATLGVKWVRFSRDGSRVISTDVEGIVHVWDARTGAEQSAIHAAATPRVRATPSLVGHDELLTFGADERPTVWDIATGAKRFELPTADGASARVDDAGATLVTLEPDRLRTWSAADGHPLGEQRIAPAPRGATLVVAGDHYLVCTGTSAFLGPVDLAAPPRVITHPALADCNVSVAPGGRYVVANADRVAWLWDMTNSDPPRALAAHAAAVWRSEISPDGTRLATAGLDHSAKLWDLASGRLLVSLDGHDGEVYNVVWSPDGRRLATTSSDQTVRLWDVDSGANLAVLHGHTDLVLDAAFDPRGERIVSGSNDASVRVFDVRDRTDRVGLAHSGPLSIASSGRSLLLVGHDARAWLYDRNKRTVTLELGPFADSPPVSRNDAYRRKTSGDLDATGRIAAIPAATAVALVQLDDPAHPRMLHHDALVRHVRFVGALVVAGLDDGKVVVWSLAGRHQRTLVEGTDPIDAIAVDGARFAVSSGQSVTVYDVADLDHPRKLPALVGNNALAFSHDGSALAGAGDDTFVRACDLRTGALLFDTRAISRLNTIAFSPDDRRVLVGDNDGAVATYDARDGRLLERQGDPRSNGWITGIAADANEVISADDLGAIRSRPIAIENRTPDAVAGDIACKVPLQLVETRLLPRVPTCE